MIAYFPIYPKLREFRASVEKALFKVDELRVNVGGGRFYKRGWKVLDYCTPWYQIPPQYIDYSFDLMTENQFPFSNNSVKLFYSEHVLEHLPDRFSVHIAREMYRCVNSEGAIRIVVPDIDLVYKAVKEENENFFYKIDEFYRQYERLVQCLVHMFAGYFVRRDHNLDVQVDINSMQNNFDNMKKIEFLNFYSEQIASRLTPEIQHRYGGFHVNWFNETKLLNLLRDAGFSKVYKTNPQESRYSEMRGIWFDTRPSWSLHIEAIK